MKLKATKTSLYKLVAEHEALPQMKKTHFRAYRGSYWLTWGDHEAYLSACAGVVMLAITKSDETSTSRNVHRLSAESLMRRGMIEE